MIASEQHRSTAAFVHANFPELRCTAWLTLDARVCPSISSISLLVPATAAAVADSVVIATAAVLAESGVPPFPLHSVRLCREHNACDGSLKHVDCTSTAVGAAEPRQGRAVQEFVQNLV